MIAVLVPDASRGDPGIGGIAEHGDARGQRVLGDRAGRPLIQEVVLPAVASRVAFVALLEGVILDEHDLGVAVVVDIRHDGVLEDGAADGGEREVHGAGRAVVHAEVALVAVRDLGRAIAVEVEDARRRDAARVVFRRAFPAVVKANALAAHLVASGAAEGAVRVRLAGAARVASRIRAGRRAGFGQRGGPGRAVRRVGRLQIDDLVKRRHRRGDLRKAVAVEVVDVRRAAGVGAELLVMEHGARRAVQDHEVAVRDQHHFGLAVERVRGAGRVRRAIRGRAARAEHVRDRT